MMYVYVMMIGVEHFVITQDALESEQPAVLMATATLQRMSVPVVKDGREKDVRYLTAKEIPTALTVDIVIPPLTLRFVQTVHKVGWVQDVEIPVYVDNRFQWTVETVFVSLAGLEWAAIASVLNMER